LPIGSTEWTKRRRNNHIGLTCCCPSRGYGSMRRRVFGVAV